MQATVVRGASRRYQARGAPRPPGQSLSPILARLAAQDADEAFLE